MATNASVSATFSEAMNNATLTTTSFTLATTIGGAAVTGTVDVNGNTATFTPSAPLAGRTQYTATITTDATDAANNALLADYSWNFTTDNGNHDLYNQFHRNGKPHLRRRHLDERISCRARLD